MPPPVDHFGARDWCQGATMSYSNIGSTLAGTTSYPTFKNHLDIYTYHQDVILPNSTINDKSLALENAIYAAAQDAYNDLLEILSVAEKQSENHEPETELNAFLPLLTGSLKIWCLNMHERGAKWSVVIVTDFESGEVKKRETYKIVRGEESGILNWLGCWEKFGEANSVEVAVRRVRGCVMALPVFEE